MDALDCIRVLVLLALWSAGFFRLLTAWACPLFMAPPVAVAMCILVLQASGLVLGSLLPGFWLLIMASLLGIGLLMADKKGWKPWLVFCFGAYVMVAALLLLQAACFGKGFWHFDDWHQWGLVVKGLCDYDRIFGFAKMKIFQRYPSGEALWGYFVHRLAFCDFRCEIANFAQALVSLACLVPSLEVFWKWHHRDCKAGRPVWLFWIGLAAWLLFYLFLCLQPKYCNSNYRTLPPDHLIYALALAGVCGYIGCPKLRSLFWLAPIVAVEYLLKQEGIYMGLGMALAASLHYVWTRSGILRKLARRNFRLFIFAFMLPLSLLIAALILPPLSWNFCCNRQFATNSSCFKLPELEKVMKCLNYKDLTYTRIRRPYFERVLNYGLFYIRSGCWLSFSAKVRLKYHSLVLVASIALAVAWPFMKREKRFRGFWLLALVIWLMALGHVMGLCIHFCLKNSDDLTSLNRYLAPCPKLLLALGFLALLAAAWQFRKHFGACLPCMLFLLLVSSSLLWFSDWSILWKRTAYAKSVAELAGTLPDKPDFSGKKVLFVCDTGKASAYDWLISSRESAGEWNFMVSFLAAGGLKLPAEMEFVKDDADCLPKICQDKDFAIRIKNGKATIKKAN